MQYSSLSAATSSGKNPTSFENTKPNGFMPNAAQQAYPQASRAVDMSVYAQQQGRYNATNVPRTPPKGARINDLSGSVPANQIWGQAYNEVAGQYGVPGVTSFTMPGSFTSQSFNPATATFGKPTSGQSFDGNMAYNAIDNRPSPVVATSTGVGGNQMQWQDALRQREAFVGNLSQRLNQYSGGQLSGPVTFDPGQLVAQANDQLANGAFFNPFSQTAVRPSQSKTPVRPDADSFDRSQFSPDVQRAMDNASQYMRGSFQNPFGNSLEANNPLPSWGQQFYDGGQGTPLTSQTKPFSVFDAQPIAPPTQGTPYSPLAGAPSLPDVPAEETEAPPRKARTSGWSAIASSRRPPPARSTLSR